MLQGNPILHRGRQLRMHGHGMAAGVCRSGRADSAAVGARRGWTASQGWLGHGDGVVYMRGCVTHCWCGMGAELAVSTMVQMQLPVRLGCSACQRTRGGGHHWCSARGCCCQGALQWLAWLRRDMRFGAVVVVLGCDGAACMSEQQKVLLVGAHSRCGTAPEALRGRAMQATA